MAGSPTAGSDDLADYAAGMLSGRLTRLRALAEDDLPVLGEWWNDPAVMVLQQPRVLPQGVSSTADMFRSWSNTPGESGFGYSIVNASDELVGHVAVFGISPTLRIGTLGIIIGPPHTERGYGTDAMRIALRLAFEELGVRKVELGVFSYNERAAHVYRTLGFVEEGRRREAIHHRATFYDEIRMGMLRAEYDGREPS